MNTSSNDAPEARIAELVAELSRSQYTREMHARADADAQMLVHMAAVVAELKSVLDAAVAALPPDTGAHKA